MGSRSTSGVFTLSPRKGGAPIQVADTALDQYTSGIQTVAENIQSVATKGLRELFGPTGPLTYGYFTFTNEHGTFRATPRRTSLVLRSRSRSTCRIRRK